MNPRNPQIQRRRQSQYRGIQYNYSTAAGDTFDFSKIGEQYTRNKEFQLAAKEKIRERLQKETEQLQDATKYEATGVAEADKLAMGVSNDIRTSLLESKKMVGQFDEDLGRVRTLKDHNELYNNLNNSAKSYAVFNEHVTKEAERIMNDPKLSGAQKEAFALSLGNVHNKAKTTEMFVDKKTGRLGMGVRDRNPNEKGEKGFQAFSVGELMFNTKNDIALFDPVADVAALQDVYADKLKTAGYSQEKVGDLKVFSTEHILTQTKGFEQMKKNAIEAFGNQDEKLISYAFDNMGIGFAGGKKGAIKVNKLDEFGNPEIDEKTGNPVQIELALTTDFEGNVMIPDEVREQAKRHYSQMVDAAFGVKTTKSGQVIKAPAPRGGASTEKKTENFVQEGYGLNPATGEYRTKFDKGSFTRSYSLDGAGQTPTEDGQGGEFNYTTASVADKQKFKNSHPDLFDSKGNMSNFDKTPTVADLEAIQNASFDSGQPPTRGTYRRTNSLSVRFGSKTTGSDLAMKNVMSRGNKPLSDFTGVAVVEEAILDCVPDPDNPGKLKSIVRYVPSSISLTGTVLDQKSKEGEALDMDPQRSAAGKRSDTYESSTTRGTSHSSISKPLNDNQLTTLIGDLNENHPGFSDAYDRALVAARRDANIKEGESDIDSKVNVRIQAFTNALRQFQHGR